MPSLTPRHIRIAMLLGGALSLGALGLLAGLILGDVATGPRSAESMAIHVPALSNEIVIGALIGVSVGLTLGVVAAVFATHGMGEVQPSRVQRVVGETLLGISAAMIGFAVHFLGIYIGMAAGVIAGGTMLGGKGATADVAVGVVSGGLLGAGVFILMPEVNMPVGGLDDLGMLPSATLALLFPLVGGVLGFERRASSVPAARDIE